MRGDAVPHHRLVAECFLGRLLTDDEVVHHRNGKKTDNRWDNLEILSRSAHGLAHGPASRRLQQTRLTTQQVKEALRGKTTKEAAQLLDVHHQTLRNRFDALLSKRRSPGGAFPASYVRRAKIYAKNPKMGVREACRRLKTAPYTLRTCCRIHDIEWVSAPLGRPSQKK
jgi:hypothetical protein